MQFKRSGQEKKNAANNQFSFRFFSDSADVCVCVCYFFFREPGYSYVSSVCLKIHQHKSELKRETVCIQRFSIYLFCMLHSFRRFYTPNQSLFNSFSLFHGARWRAALFFLSLLSFFVCCSCCRTKSEEKKTTKKKNI